MTCEIIATRTITWSCPHVSCGYLLLVIGGDLITLPYYTIACYIGGHNRVRVYAPSTAMFTLLMGSRGWGSKLLPAPYVETQPSYMSTLDIVRCVTDPGSQRRPPIYM